MAREHHEDAEEQTGDFHDLGTWGLWPFQVSVWAFRVSNGWKLEVARPGRGQGKRSLAKANLHDTGKAKVDFYD